MDSSTPQLLRPSEWHLPFATDDEWHELADVPFAWALESAKILSVARCASTSYKTVDGFDIP